MPALTRRARLERAACDSPRFDFTSDASNLPLKGTWFANDKSKGVAWLVSLTNRTTNAVELPLVNGNHESAVSPDGRFVKVSDGNGTAGLLSPREAGAVTRIADVQACDNNTDSDDDPEICAEVYGVPLLTGPTFGTPPLLNDVVHYQYEIQVSDLLNTEDADIRAFNRDELLWERKLPNDMLWTSVITVTRIHLIGSGTRFTDSGESILNIGELPASAESELVILNRADGETVFRAPITDDSTSTVTVGPDGSVYVTMFALMHIFSLETRPVAGIIRFAPED